MNNAHVLTHYKVYNLILSSDNILRELYSTKAVKVDIQILHASLEFNIPTQSFMRWYLPGSEVWLSFFKIKDGYLLRFNELADFFVNYDGSKIIYKPSQVVPSNTIRHLLLDQVLPLVINLRGGEALHASSVLTQKGVIAFAGATGLGKSTVAGSFVRAGYPLLSDDCLALTERNQTICAIPAYPGLRLWKDSAAWLFGENSDYNTVAHYTEKYQVDIGIQPETYTQPQPLRRLYSIADIAETNGKADIRIEQLSQRESFMALVRFSFRLDITDQNMLKRQFHFLERLASIVSIRRLIFPRDFKLLPAVQEAILNDLQDLGN